MYLYIIVLYSEAFCLKNWKQWPSKLLIMNKFSCYSACVSQTKFMLRHACRVGIMSNSYTVLNSIRAQRTDTESGICMYVRPKLASLKT